MQCIHIFKRFSVGWVYKIKYRCHWACRKVYLTMKMPEVKQKWPNKCLTALKKSVLRTCRFFCRGGLARKLGAPFGRWSAIWVFHDQNTLDEKIRLIDLEHQSITHPCAGNRKSQPSLYFFNKRPSLVGNSWITKGGSRRLEKMTLKSWLRMTSNL